MAKPMKKAERQSAQDYSNEILMAVGEAREPYPHENWRKKYGSKCLDGVVTEIVQRAMRGKKKERGV